MRLAPPVADPQTVPRAQTFSGAVLLADIAGFTELTTRLAAGGRLGAEQLTAELNNCFGLLIDLVERFDGDVYRFAGDAMLAVWPGPAEEAALTGSIQRAALCALAIQDALRDYRVSDRGGLSVHIGIAAGPLLAAHLGGIDQRVEFLLTGTPLTQAGVATNQASPGEIIIAPEAATMAGDLLEVQPSHDEGMRLKSARGAPPAARSALLAARPGVHLAASAARQYLLPSVLARLDAGQSDWIAELRQVATIFVNIDDLDCTASDAIDRLQNVVSAVQSALELYEGSLCQMVMADKGIVLHCPFGLPQTSHEDDAVRASLAALRIEADLHAMGLTPSIGIATGEAFCGPIGNSRRREYNLMGDIVNLAASLAVVAGGRVCCDARTMADAHRRVQFRILNPAQVKGRPKPVDIFECVAPRNAAQTADSVRIDALVGRASERSQIAERLAGFARELDGGCLVIEGEPGMGKSSLLRVLNDQAVLLGLRSVAGAADSMEVSGYLAWRAVFGQLLAAPADGGSIEPGRLLEYLAGGSAVEPSSPLAHASNASLLPLLRQIIPVELAENELTAGMSGEARADYTRELLIRLLENAAVETPIVVVLDDAQWLDSASWSLARLVVNRMRRVLLVIATRPLDGEAPFDAQLILGGRSTRRIGLAGLSAEESAELVRQCLEVGSMPESLADMLWARSEGHPLYLRELVFGLLDAGTLKVQDGRCYLDSETAQLQAANLPTTLQGAITARIDHLSAGQQLTLKVASVVGRDFSLAQLRDVFPVEHEDSIASDLAQLESLHIVQVARYQPSPAYTFSHVLIQDVAYNLMLFAQRERLHRSIAEWYEREYSGDLRPYYPVLAHHWRRAFGSSRDDVGAARVAVGYLERAADAAIAQYANLEAIRDYEEALKLDAELPVEGTSGRVAQRARHARWKQRLGETYFRVGRLPEAIDRLRAALVDLGSPAPTSPATLAGAALIDAGEQIVRRLLRRTVSPHGIGATRARLEQTAQVYASLSLYTFITMDELASVGALLRGHNLAERAGPSGVLMRTSYQMSTFTALLLARPNLFEQYIARAESVAKQVHDPASEAEMLFGGVGLYRIVQARWEEAEAATARAERLFSSIGDRRWAELALYQRSNIAVLRGDISLGLELSREALISAERRGDAQTQAWLLMQQGHAHAAIGEFQTGLNDLYEADQRLESSRVDLSDPAARFWSVATRSLAHVRLGDTDTAQTLAESAAAQIKPYLNFMYYSIRGFGNLAEASLLLWQVARSAHPSAAGQLRRTAQQAVRAARQFARSSPVGRPQALLWNGVFEYHDGRPERATRDWRRAAVEAARLGMPYEEGLANAYLGRHGTGRPSQRQAELERAYRILASIGARHHLAPIADSLTIADSGRS
jgi:class 3 adenylate cyclase/tetratricopeptide (TPR) repeat protein